MSKQIRRIRYECYRAGCPKCDQGRKLLHDLEIEFDGSTDAVGISIDGVLYAVFDDRAFAVLVQLAGEDHVGDVDDVDNADPKGREWDDRVGRPTGERARG